MKFKTSQLDAITVAFEAVEEDFSLPLLLTMLNIARNPGLSVNDLAEKLSVPQQTASRYVAVLQGRYETFGKSTIPFAKSPMISLELSPDDPRKRALSLTADGEKRLAIFLNHIYGKA